jgi:hypothetical protein
MEVWKAGIAVHRFRLAKSGKYYRKSVVVGVVVAEGLMSEREQKHQFSVGGYAFSLSREQAERRLAALKAKDIEEVRKIYVEAKGRRFPIKQALTTVEPNIMRSGCNSTDGIRVFRRLGLKVGQI